MAHLLQEMEVEATDLMKSDAFLVRPRLFDQHPVPAAAQPLNEQPHLSYSHVLIRTRSMIQVATDIALL